MNATHTAGDRARALPGLAVLRDSAWILFGVLIGTTVCGEILPAPLAITPADAASAASIAAIAMLLGSLRDGPRETGGRAKNSYGTMTRDARRMDIR